MYRDDYYFVEGKLDLSLLDEGLEEELEMEEEHLMNFENLFTEKDFEVHTDAEPSVTEESLAISDETYQILEEMGSYFK